MAIYKRRRRDVRPVMQQRYSKTSLKHFEFWHSFRNYAGGKYMQSILQDGSDVSDVKLTQTLTGYWKGFILCLYTARVSKPFI